MNNSVCVLISNTFSLQIALSTIRNSEIPMSFIVLGDYKNFQIIERFCFEFDRRETKLEWIENRIKLFYVLIKKTFLSSDQLVFGDVRSRYFRFFCAINIFGRNFCLLDDGSNSLRVTATFLDNLRGLEDFYSVYCIKQRNVVNCKKQVIKYFNARRDRMVSIRCHTLIVGSAEVDFGFMDREKYLKWIKLICEQKSIVIYKPHRREHHDKLSQIESQCSCLVERDLPPLECCDLANVKELYGVGSSGFEIISILWPHIKIYSPPDELFEGVEAARKKVFLREIN